MESGTGNTRQRKGENMYSSSGEAAQGNGNAPS